MAHTAPATGTGRQLSRLAVRNQPKQLTPEEIAARDNARREVDKVLRMHGIKTQPHFDDVGVGEEKTLYCKVEFATAIRQRTAIVGLLDQQGWNLDPERLSRATFALETIRVRHKQTGARMTVVVRIPTGEALQLPQEAP